MYQIKIIFIIKNKSQHRYSTLSDNPHAYLSMKGDSAASNHSFAAKDKHLTNICNTSILTMAILPNKETITTNLEGDISLPTLSQQATNAKIFPKLNYSLISLGQSCDNGYIVTLTKHDLIVKKNNQIVLKGNRRISGDKLLDIHLPQQNHQNHNYSYPAPTQHSLNIILRVDKKAHDLAAYLHAAAACFSPSKSTFIKAIQKILVSWPGFTTHLIKKHLPPSTHTELGHIRAER